MQDEAQKVLDNANDQLKSMYINHRWQSVSAINVQPFTDYAALLKLDDVPLALIWILIAVCKFFFTSACQNLTAFIILLVLYAVANAKPVYKSIKSAISMKDVMITLFKEAVSVMCVLTLGKQHFAEYFQLNAVFEYGLIPILVLKMALIQNVVFQHQLQQKIKISGEDWTLYRLPMVNPKAVALLEYVKQINVSLRKPIQGKQGYQVIQNTQ